MRTLFHTIGWRIVPGLVMALGCGLLAKWGAFQALEHVVYNYLYQVRGGQAWDSRLVLVAIDDVSLQKLGRFPWSRQRYVQLLQTIAADQPSVVGIDLLFSEQSPADRDLATAMAQGGPVVLAQAATDLGDLLRPVPALKDAAIASGHILYQPDADGITRNVSLRLGTQPSFGLAVVQSYSLVQDQVALPPVDQPFWLNWTGRSQDLPHYSFVDVVQRRIPAGAFRNKIVLVGVTATGIDALNTPYDRNPPASGVILQATLINNLLQQTTMHPVTTPWSGVLILLAGAGLGLVFSTGTSINRLCRWLGLGGLWVGVGIVLFNAGYWLPIAFPLGLITATAMATTISQRLCLYWQLKRQVRDLWNLYHQDLVVQPPHFDGVTRAYSCIGSDEGRIVTQLADLADQFGRSQSAQAAIARSLSTGLLAADIDGRVWFCNPVMAQWLGIRVGDYITDRLIADWCSEDVWREAYQRLVTSQEPFLHVLQRGDRWFALKLEPLTYTTNPASQPGQGARIDGLLLVLDNITIQKQAEIALEHQVQELKRLSQLKDDFLSTVSHELRSPMANIQMAIKLLQISPTPDRRTHYLNILQTECSREIELINDLLDLQRLEADAQVFQTENIYLQDWLPPIIEPFYERAEAHQQTIEVIVDRRLPILISDSSSLQRVLAELVNNACKYTPPAGVIKISVHANTSHVELVVSNSGSEIPAAELPRIFEKFYRVPQADPWKRGGTGLGLALVKKLVHCLGGNIQVQSRSGQTTFTVQLPISVCPPSCDR